MTDASDPAQVRPPPRVVILMATRNGARWLPGQLQSLREQSLRDWALWVGDDGSTDETPAILEAFRAAESDRHEIRLLAGPRQGAAQNFLALLTHPDLPTGPGIHVALSDQDDIWLPGKLARGLEHLAALPDPQRPAIYGAQSVHLDEAGRVVGRSRRPRRPLCIGNAVVQNLISGHSSMLNPAAVRLARQAGCPPGIGFQDWWLSLLVIAAGGTAVVDGETVLFYRQHGRNVMGAPQGVLAHARRIRALFGHDYARWIAANLAGLASGRVPLTPEARTIVARLAEPARPGLARPRMLRALGIHRQSGFATAMLYLAAALGRV